MDDDRTTPPIPAATPELIETGRAIIDASLYLTLATSDAGGVPWATPVFFAPIERREFVWVSRPEARHSRSIAVRPEVALVVFDSRAPISTGQAVYAAGRAGLVPEDDQPRCIDAFSRCAQERGGTPWSLADVGPDTGLFLYRAVAAEQWVLDTHDRRIPVPVGLGMP